MRTSTLLKLCYFTNSTIANESLLPSNTWTVMIWSDWLPFNYYFSISITYYIHCISKNATFLHLE